MISQLSDPLDLPRGPQWRNRVALAPLTNMQSHADGTLGDDEYAFLTRRAEGGFGLVTTCGASPSREGIAFPGQLGVWSDDHLPGLTRLADGIRAAGAASAVQIHHAGSRSNPAVSGLERVSAFASEKHAVRGLTTDEIRRIIDDFAVAARRCERAGFDGATLHGGHGYLLCQFLSPTKNLRGDGYGGDYAGRTRIYHDVIAAIRAATGPQFQLGCRISPEKYDYDTTEALRFAQDLIDHGGLDYLDMSLWDSFKLPDEEAFHPRRLVDVFGALVRTNGTRLGVAGHIFSAADGQVCLDAGFDFVYYGRGAILHHDLARQVTTDSGFVARRFPVSRAYLTEQAVGRPFADYLATGWKNYVTD